MPTPQLKSRTRQLVVCMDSACDIVAMTGSSLIDWLKTGRPNTRLLEERDYDGSRRRVIATCFNTGRNAHSEHVDRDVFYGRTKLCKSGFTILSNSWLLTIRPCIEVTSSSNFTHWWRGLWLLSIGFSLFSHMNVVNEVVSAWHMLAARRISRQ